jgi:transcriptional regulator with XRE-family HTH domain
MVKSTVTLTTACSQSLDALGRRLRNARLRRLLSAEAVAIHAGITRQTLSKIELGAPTVTISSYIRVLEVLGLLDDVNRVASDNKLRQQLREGDFQLRERAPRRVRSESNEGGQTSQTAMSVSCMPTDTVSSPRVASNDSALLDEGSDDASHWKDNEFVHTR